MQARCVTCLIRTARCIFVQYNSSVQTLPSVFCQNHHLFNLSLSMKNWPTVKPAGINDFSADLFCVLTRVKSYWKDLHRIFFSFAWCYNVCRCVCASVLVSNCANGRGGKKRGGGVEKKRALKAILSFWSLWWNLWRGTARGLFCTSGRSASDCEKLYLTLYNTLAFSYIRQEGERYDLARQTALPYSNCSVKTAAWLCVKLFARLQGPCYFAMHVCVRACACVCMRVRARVCVPMFSSGYLQGKKKKKEDQEDPLTQPSSSAPAILISTALSTSTPEGGSNQRAWFKSLGFKALGRGWTTLSHLSEKYSNLVHVRKSK